MGNDENFKFQFLVNWVWDRFDWQFFENVIGTPYALNQYYRKYFLRLGNDVWQQYKNRHPNEFEDFAEFNYKKKGNITVRIQDSTQLLI